MRSLLLSGALSTSEFPPDALQDQKKFRVRHVVARGLGNKHDIEPPQVTKIMPERFADNTFDPVPPHCLGRHLSGNRNP